MTCHSEAITALHERVRAQYRTPHALCRQTGLPRATVYQVLAGKYPGNVQRQVDRITAVLDGRTLPASLSLANVQTMLEKISCDVCSRKGRCTRKKAQRCARVHEAQALAVTTLYQTLGGA